jgi:LysM repeat protein
MSGKNSAKRVLDSYKKRQQMMPIITWGLAILLVLIGVLLLVLWFSGPSRPQIALFASATPTATETFTPTATTPPPTATLTPTITITPTETVTPTRSGPMEVTVGAGDTCWDLAQKYEVDLEVLLSINGFAPGQCPISEGNTILIPAPGQSLPTSTPLPPDTPRGTRIEYTIASGDTLDIIASKFNTTVELIMSDNNISDKNTINVGDTLVIRVNMVTATPTLRPTLTHTPGGPTETTAATATATATP